MRRDNRDERVTASRKRLPRVVLAWRAATGRTPTQHATSPDFRFELDRPERLVVPVLERHGHHLARAVDRDVAEELHVEARRQVLPLRRWTAP